VRARKVTLTEKTSQKKKNGVDTNGKASLAEGNTTWREWVRALGKEERQRGTCAWPGSKSEPLEKGKKKKKNEQKPGGSQEIRQKGVGEKKAGGNRAKETYLTVGQKGRNDQDGNDPEQEKNTLEKENELG